MEVRVIEMHQQIRHPLYTINRTIRGTSERTHLGAIEILLELRSRLNIHHASVVKSRLRDGYAWL